MSFLPFQNNQLKQIQAHVDKISWEDINSGKVLGLLGIREEKTGESGKIRTVVTLSDDVTAKTFTHVLEFLYAGKLGQKQRIFPRKAHHSEAVVF
jgi:hypothetical protein